MNIKYLARDWYSTTIEVVEVERETESSVWVNGSRRKRSGGRDRYFDEWKDAHEWLIELAQRKLDDAKVALQRAQGRMGNIKGMKPPELNPTKGTN